MSAGRCIVCPAGLVAEEGDRLCARCALDVDAGSSHPMHCWCGPCLVIRAAQNATGIINVWAWAEVVAVRGNSHAPALTLDDYLARRDAGATTKDAAVGRGKD